MACVNHPDRESIARCVTCAAELCDECRTEIDGKNYCANDVPAAEEAPAEAAAEAPAPAAGADDPSQEQPVMAALAYVFGIIVPIIILVTDMKKSRYMRFHAFNSLFFTVAIFVISMGLGIIMAIVGAIPVIGFIGAILGLLLSIVLPLAVLILVIILAIKAYNKQELELPVITKMAREQADKMRV